MGRRKWIIKTLKRMERRQKIIDRRTRMLAAGLRELFILGEDYVSMVACQDEVDVAVLFALREAGAAGRQSGELSVQLDIDHRDVSRRIYRMNRRMGQGFHPHPGIREGLRNKPATNVQRNIIEGKRAATSRALGCLEINLDAVIILFARALSLRLESL